MFPIGWMYYFGTNLESRFQVPDFWPKPEETHKIPFEKEEQMELAKRLREVRLEKRRRRLEMEGIVGDGNDAPVVKEVETDRVENVERVGGVASDRGFGKGAIERWARGE